MFDLLTELAIQEIYLPRVLPRIEREVHPSRTLGTEGDQ